MEKFVEAITKWLRDSGMKKNQAKLCLFFKQDVAPIRLYNGCLIACKRSMNILGLILDLVV
jgi:hypothetical protein